MIYHTRGEQANHCSSDEVFVLVVLYRFCLFLLFCYSILEMFRQCGIICFLFDNYLLITLNQRNVQIPIQSVPITIDVGV
jgi:hypothetical protein